MPTFKYKAKKGPQEIVEGFIEAPHQQMAVEKILQLGATPIDVLPAVQSAQGANVKTHKRLTLTLFKKVSRRDIVLFTRQMSDLVEGAVPILRSLHIISQQTKNPHLKEQVDDMYTAVKDGGSLSSALARHRNTFSSLYINMVRTGELSGNLEIVLNRLAGFLEKELESHNKVQSSLAYPGFILAVGIITVFVLLTFVIPRLSVMFDDLGQSLPLLTVILINVSGFFARFWWAILGGVVGAGFLLQQWAHSPGGRIQLDAFKLKMPFLGQFIMTVEISRFSRTLGTLVENGVTITDALNSVWAIIDNRVLQEEIKLISQDVTNGLSLKESLKQRTLFPVMALNMIAVGEETGRLDRGLYKIADTYEREADQTVKTMISLLGPVVLVVIVSLVGLVVIAMLLPIFQMNMIIQ